MKQKKKGMAPVLLLIFMILAVGMLTGDILGEPMKIVKVEDYVCNTCSLSESWTSAETFERSILFDFSISYTLSNDDALLYVIDSVGNTKEIFRGTHTFECQPYPNIHSPVVHAYPVDTYEFSAYESIGSLKTLEGRPISTVSVVGMTPPYKLHVVTKRTRGSACGTTGLTYKYGIVTIGKIAVLDQEPEPIITPEPELIITPEPELITDPVPSPIDDIIDDIKDIFEPTPEDDIIIPDGKEYLDYVYQEPADVPELYVEPTFMNKISNIITGLKLWISLNIGL